MYKSEALSSSGVSSDPDSEYAPNEEVISSELVQPKSSSQPKEETKNLSDTSEERIIGDSSSSNSEHNPDENATYNTQEEYLAIPPVDEEIEAQIDKDGDIGELLPIADSAMHSPDEAKQMHNDKRKLLELLFDKGMKPREIVKNNYVELKKTQVYHLYSLYKKTGNIKRLKGSGRKSKLDSTHVQALNNIMEEHKGNISIRRIKIILMEEYDIKLSSSSVRRILLSTGFIYTLPNNKVLNGEVQRSNRIDWAKKHQDVNWESVIFLDESTFYINSAWNRKRWVHKSQLNYYSNKAKGTKLNVLGAICAKGRLPVHAFEEKMNSELFIEIIGMILTEATKLFEGEKIYLCMDNASYHNSKEVKDYLDKENVVKLPWPAYSPDLNPIENVWGLMKTSMGNKVYTTLYSLRKAIYDHWDNLNDDLRKRICNSMPTRLNKCIEEEGILLKY
ncbi:unnamed protein product [Moneuplotes crassus]|uniref:Tc1-like transposase DDE domain-containing protein n=1 Tax=Euplotes crassus TaxID=5936 RepID=A0AAD1URL5_EUPCR|nr:unnamed protein product [Moneuplotes crassus]